jgi:hypothetical protein
MSLSMHRLSPLFPSLLSLLAATSALSAADLVLLSNGQRIAGTIDSTADVSPDQVAINTGNGILRISKDRVAAEDLGYPARRAKVKDNDLKGLVGLARWCRAKGMNPEALELLSLAMRLPGFDLAARALHVRLVDEIKGPEEALPLYRAYRIDGGKDPETIARLDQLEKAIADFEAQGDDTPAAAAVAAKPLTTLQGGLESKGWDSEALQWSNPATAKLITLTSNDNLVPALQVDFKSGDKDKAAIKRLIHLTITENSVLTFWAQTPGDRPVNVAVAVKTGNQYVFHESPQMTVKPGDFQQLKFDLKASNFKSAATGWAGTGRVADLNDVKEVQVLIYNGSSDGSLLITNMGFPPKQEM